MARKIRLEYDGAIHHVINRGDRRESRSSRMMPTGKCFLKTLAEACQKAGWQVHTYCLMGNHYHLVVETPNANLVAGMAWLQSRCNSANARLHQWMGEHAPVASAQCQSSR